MSGSLELVGCIIFGGLMNDFRSHMVDLMIYCQCCVKNMSVASFALVLDLTFKLLITHLLMNK